MSLSDIVHTDWCDPASLKKKNPLMWCRKLSKVYCMDSKLSNGRKEPTGAQKSDTELIELYNKALSRGAEKVPVCYFVTDGVLLRKCWPHEVPASDA